MKSNCTLYIDEAGDLGIGKGSDWFILSGVLLINRKNYRSEKPLKISESS